jgi:hypothetical protein
MAVCKNEKEANRLVARYSATDSYGDAYVESIPYVQDAGIQRVEVLDLSCEIFDDGTQKERDPQYRIEWPFDSLYDLSECNWRWVRAPMYNGNGGRLEARGTDHELVRKVYSDQKAMLRSDDAMRARREIKG